MQSFTLKMVPFHITFVKFSGGKNPTIITFLYRQRLPSSHGTLSIFSSRQISFKGARDAREFAVPFDFFFCNQEDEQKDGLLGKYVTFLIS